MKTTLSIFTVLLCTFFSCNEKSIKENDYSNTSTKVINVPDKLDITSHSDSIRD